MTETREVTRLLLAWKSGESTATDQLFPLIYDELHQIAHRQMRREHDGHTLSATSLVHEAYPRLIDQKRVEWRDRAHFFAIASTVMRRLLIDHARWRSARTTSGGEALLSGHAVLSGFGRQAATLLDIDQALESLAAMSERQSQVVECRFFGGLTEEETAAALAVSTRTVRRDWIKARAWLYQRLNG